MNSVLSRLIGFSGLSLFSALIPLMVLPLVARVGGDVAWGTIGVGQAVGSLVGAFSLLGWGVIGPAKIAVNPDSIQRDDIYASSFWSRLITFMIIGFIGSVVAVALTPSGQEFLVVLMTISAGLSCLSLAWFSVGAGSPRILAIFEVIPRLAASLAAFGMVAATGMVFTYPLLIIVGTCMGLVFYNIMTYRRILPPWISWQRLVNEIREDAAATSVNFLGSGFSVIPVPFVATIGSITDVANFSSADRLYRYSLFTITSLANSLQPWVLEPSSFRVLLRRQRLATLSHLILAVVGGVGLAVFG